MKIIHLSDLHIGKMVNRISMLEEQRNAFNQITGYVKKEKPDAVIIAGDIYDRSAPGADAVCLFDDFLTELANEDTAVMIVSGNHDSPERIGYASRLLLDKNIYLCGAFNGTLENIVLTDEYGEVNFWLLPFIKPIYVRQLLKENETDNYEAALRAVLKTANIDYSSRNVLLSHQFYTKNGISPVRSESEMNPVGGLDAIDAGLIKNFDYAALGHLHGAQSAGSAHIRYAGSPIKYSFSEWQHKKSASLVELNKKGSLKITELPLTPLRDMREIKGTIDEIMKTEASEDYMRIILTDEEEIIDPVGKLRSIFPNLMSLDFENSRSCLDTIINNTEIPEKLSPYDLFMDFFLNTQGSAMTERQAEIVRELLETEIET
ncbi:MAG: exonuclease SbcCD subunit D [Treponema sp.]|nr:exonuclease SbcCD subunit D [Treponema sp.]